MNPGELDTQIILEKSVATKGTRGETINSWYFFTQAWAKIEYGSRGDISDPYRMAGEQGITMTVRYNPAINSEMRIKIDDEYYYIAGVSPVGRKMYMKIEATLKQ